MLYKYRGLTNLEFAIDIFVRGRLHAAKFTTLNDPMEGIFRYGKGTLSESHANAIFLQKNQYCLTALSETSDNMLMWSYYADSRSGIAIGVEIDDQGAEVVPIEYVDTLDLDPPGDEDVAKRILSKKFKLWRHEREQRVFVKDKSFVSIKIKELIFGVSAKDETKELVKKIAEKFCPEIQVSTIESDKLEWTGSAR